MFNFGEFERSSRASISIIQVDGAVLAIAVAVGCQITQAEIKASQVKRVIVGVLAGVRIEAACAAIHFITIVAAKDGILACATADLVFALAAGQLVIPVTADQRIVVIAAKQRVVACATVDKVVALVAHQQVIARAIVNAAYRCVEIDVGDVDARVIAIRQILIHRVGNLEVIDRAFDVHQGRVVRVSIGAIISAADQGFVTANAVLVLSVDAAACIDLNRRARPIGADRHDDNFRRVINVIDAEADVGHILGEVQTICRAFAILVRQRCQGAVGIGRLIVASDRMHLLLVRRECRLGRFGAAGDREGHIDVARVLNKAAAQIIIIVDSGGIVGVWCLVPLKALALCCAARRRTVTGVVVAVDRIFAAATGDGVIAAVAFEVVVAFVALDAVVATLAKDRVIPSTAGQHIVATNQPVCRRCRIAWRGVSVCNVVIFNRRKVRAVADEIIGFADLKRFVCHDPDGIRTVKVHHVNGHILRGIHGVRGTHDIGIFGDEFIPCVFGVAVQLGGLNKGLRTIVVIQRVVPVLDANSYGGRIIVNSE